MKSYRDIVGDGGSEIVAQVEAQKERIAENLSGVRHRLAIASGKGGVGKSTLTWQLSLALSRLGWKIAILDADINGPTQARLAGLEQVTPVPGASGRGLALPRTREGIGVFSLGSFLAAGAPAEFPSIAPDDSFLWRATQEFTALSQILAGIEWGTLDALLIDLPPGTERTIQFAQFFGADTSIVLVTQPSDLARGVVARSVAALAELDNRLVGQILNMDGYACPSCKTVQPLFSSTGGDDLDLPRLGSVPFDPELGQSGDNGGAKELGATAAAGPIAAIAAHLAALLEVE